jgi:hypothetical protein
MTTQTTIRQIASIVLKEFGRKIVFATKITIKKSPHSWPVRVVGLEIDYVGDVWFIDSKGKWQKLEQSTADTSLISNSVLQRIKSITSVNSNKCTTS